MAKVHIKKFESKIINIIFFLILLILINGRSLLGVYIFGFRIAEYLVGFCLIYYLYVIYKIKYFTSVLNGIVHSNFLLILIFIILNFVKSADYTNTYVFRSSSYIWYISLLYLGYLIFNKIKLNDKYFVLGYIGLLIQYIFNVIYYPESLINFYENNSDKVDFLKGSEIAIFFIVVTFFSNKLYKKGIMIDVFFLISALYVPLVLFKSRSAGIAVFIYFIVQLYQYRKHFKKDKRRTLILSICFIILLSCTSHFLVGNIFGIGETDDAIAQVLRHKYVVSNTYDGEASFIYFFEGRFRSADGNFDWRLQLWQEIISISREDGNVLFGRGFNDPSPIFADYIYSGTDGLNLNSHNYLINIYITTGLLGVIIVIYFFYLIFKTNKKGFSNKEFLIFLTPLFFISMFDGAMENPYFGSTFYFFLSSFFSGLKFTKNI